MPTATTMQRVIVTLPPALLAQLEDVATRLNYSRSRLIREALEQYLDAQRTQKLRELLKEGYVVHAARDLRICEEFAATDYEATIGQVPSLDTEQSA